MGDLQRIYVSKGVHRRLKSARERYNRSMVELSQEAIGSYFDEKGRRKEARLSDDTLDLIRDMSEDIGRTPDEIVIGVIDTVSTLFDPDLSFCEMIRSVPEIGEDLMERKRKRKEAENEGEVD